MKENMHVAIVDPKSGSVRGVGFYTERLFAALTRNKRVKVTIVPASFNPFAYKNFDLVHFPYFDPFFLNIPWIRFYKTVVTIHDLTPIVLEKGFPRGMRGEIKWQIQKIVAKEVDYIVTDSYASKKDIERILGTHKNIDVIYAAAGEEFTMVSDKKKLDVAAKKLSLPKEYILYVGDVNYNKNLKNLILSFSQVVKQKNFANLKLVLVGKSFLNKNLSEVTGLEKVISSSDLDNKVIFTGFVDPKYLPSVYSLAKLYIQPSIYEGFGLPVVEAMSCGCPVLLGKNSSLVELGGGVASYTDTSNIEEFAGDLVGILTNISNNKIDRKLLVAQANKFSWDKSATDLISIYEKVLERK